MLKRLRHVLATGDFSVRELAVLMLLKAEGSLLHREIARKLMVNSPAISRAIDGLCIQGMAVRVRDPADRRDVIVSLSPEGEAFAGRLA